MGDGDIRDLPDPAGPERRRNEEVATELRRRASTLERAAENPFRVRAYRRAASQIERLSEDIEETAREGRLAKISGIGEDLAGRILEILVPDRQEPPFVQMIRRVTGLTRAQAFRLFEELRIRTLEDLVYLIRSHLLASLPRVDLPSTGEMLDRLKTIQSLSPEPPAPDQSL